MNDTPCSRSRSEKVKQHVLFHWTEYSGISLSSLLFCSVSKLKKKKKRYIGLYDIIL